MRNEQHRSARPAIKRWQRAVKPVVNNCEDSCELTILHATKPLVMKKNQVAVRKEYSSNVMNACQREVHTQSRVCIHTGPV